jgi:acetate kinase
MRVLVVNSGSSSLKVDVVEETSGARAAARVERIGRTDCTLRLGEGPREALEAADHAAALQAVLPHLLAGEAGGGLAAVGHRVVHGGERFRDPVWIDDAVEAAIEALSTLAPLHNPPALAGIRVARRLLPGLPQAAVFDTAFHATLPPRARTYALPVELADQHGIRRYGFHGTSHAWVAARAARHLGEDLRDLRLLTCHLGNGASVAAVEHGRCVETSMGMTPLEGLVMGTRSGDIDPGVLLSLMREEHLDADALDVLLNQRSGLAGLSGVGRDMRDIEERAAAGDARCRLALQVFCHRLHKYIGAYAAVMGGVDAIVFTGGIGENSALVRHRATQRLAFLGSRLDEDRNRAARVDADEPVAVISRDHSRVRLLVVQSDEALAVARATSTLLREADRVAQEPRIPVAISARHVHLTDAAVERLFGTDHRLTPRQPLSQPGQFACEETVTLVGPRRSIEGVGVVGPTRPRCQVELSRTDEFQLGVDAPVRCSGDLAGTPGIVLEGPAGRIALDDGVICAQRHIHMTPEDAERFGVEHKDIVEVALDTEGRDLVFADVVVRVKPSYRLEMHLDTDEGNAAELGRRGASGVLVETDQIVQLRRRRAGPA